MSTRSRIGRQLSSGTILSVYCHYDGYLEGVGDRLRQHYQNPKKIAALIALGDLSALGEEVAPPPGIEHRFDGKRAPGVTVAYGRDRGDPSTKPRRNVTLQDFLGDHEEYSYLWRDGKWYVWCHHTGSSIQGGELTVEMVAEALGND